MTDTKRHAPIAQPTEERSADQSTPSASGLGAERPGVNREQDDEDVAARTGRGIDTPRRYDEDADDKTVPPDESSLKINI